MIIFGLCNISFNKDVECLIIFLISINKNSLFRSLKSKIPFINNSLYNSKYITPILFFNL